MLNKEQRFIANAESVRAEVLYDMSFVISANEFHALDFHKKLEEERNLDFNIYRNHIHNAPL
jgi:hypothetical protein